MPADLARQQSGLLQQLLLVVFAEVEVVVGGGVQGEDVVGGFELGDGDEADWGVRGGFGGFDAGEDGGEGGGEVFGSRGVDSHFGGFVVWSVGHGGIGSLREFKAVASVSVDSVDSIYL